MVPIRSASLLLGLLLICALFKDSLALAHQGALTTSNGNEHVDEAKEDDTSINQKGLPNDTIVTHSQETRIKGRKMITEKVMQKEMMKDEGVNGASSETSGSTHSTASKRGPGREEFNVESKLSYTSLLHMKVKVAGLFPFSADYSVPRPHPPKNN